MLPIYRVRARNTSTDSENKIHDDSVAASYGFRGALVPGVTVFAYVTVPLVERFGQDFGRGLLLQEANDPRLGHALDIGVVAVGGKNHDLGNQSGCRPLV